MGFLSNLFGKKDDSAEEQNDQSMNTPVEETTEDKPETPPSSVQTDMNGPEEKDDGSLPMVDEEEDEDTVPESKDMGEGEEKMAVTDNEQNGAEAIQAFESAEGDSEETPAEVEEPAAEETPAEETPAEETPAEESAEEAPAEEEKKEEE